MGLFRSFWKGIADSSVGDLVATRIRNKLAVGMLAVGLTPLFVLGFALYQALAGVLEANGFQNMEPVLDTIGKVFFIVAVGASVLILIISLSFANGLTRQTEAITNMLNSIGIGDFNARAEIVSRDELGTVAASLNSMCDNTLSLIQSREERDAIQGDIQILMEEVSEIANGDLTISANVNRDLTGGIADAINFMISQLRDVVRRVKRATEQVTRSAHDIRSTTEHLSRGSEAQAAQILDTSSAIDEMSLSIGQVADNTDESAMVARQARESAHKGTKAVQDTIQGMNRIRDQVQDSAKRIKRLGESSQEIGEIVQLISDIADRTSILALNASIQAAMAGDAGQGFAVVAEEVERLAERSNEATKQIAALIKAIQGETSEAIAAMEESTREVVSGSTLAVQAGEALEEIDEVSSRLDELIHSISLATKQQARGAEALSKSMNEISGVTKQTAEGTKQAARAVGGMASLAEELRSSVSAFKLPEDHGRMTQSLVDLRAEDLMRLPETVGAGR
jgi:methyl-accepting chemotaxis protein